MNYLPSDHNSYDKALDVFNAKSGRLKREAEWAATEFPKLVCEKLAVKKNSGDDEPTIRSLSIGTGEGNFSSSFDLMKEYCFIISSFENTQFTMHNTISVQNMLLLKVVMILNHIEWHEQTFDYILHK